MLYSSGSLAVGSGGSFTSRALTGTGNILNDGAVVLGGTNGSSTYSGAISGGGTLVKTGTGTLIFTGENTYSGGTTISGGTLQIGNGGANGSLAGNIVDNAILQINRSGSLTLGSVISGTGSVSLAGGGTTIFTADNTYSGLTTVGAGNTLQLGNGGASGSLVGNINNAGTVVFNRSDVFTYSGTISNAGGVRIDSGNLTYTTAQTYTGVTTIAGGAVLTLSGINASLAGNIVDNGSLVFNRTTPYTFGSVVSGTGSVLHAGLGTLIFTGTNTYSGGTTISGGTLQLGNGGATGSVVGNIVDNGLLAFNRTGTYTYGGQISGTGGVALNLGSITFTNAQTYTGPTTINSGASLTLAGPSASITGDVANFGVLTFSNSQTYAGSISGTGNVTFTSPGAIIVTGNSNYSGSLGVFGAGVSIQSGSVVTTSELKIGSNGVLSITSGGSLTTQTSYLGWFGPSGSLIVSGSGSTWTTSGSLHVGSQAGSTGTLSIQNGGTVIADNVVVIGYNNNTTGVVSVSGTGSVLDAVYLRVGYSGNGTLTIRNGGMVLGGADVRGITASTVGTVVVDGIGSKWTTGTTGIQLGGTGAGSISVLNGGRIDADSIFAGATAGAPTSTINVAGAGSILTVTSSGLYLGLSGAATALIQGGGSIVTTSIDIGLSSPGVGRLTVDGVGSQLAVGVTIDVGTAGTGTLTAQNGGVISGSYARIGLSAGGSGALTVVGSGSQLTLSSGLYVGGSATNSGGNGSVTLTGGGSAVVGGTTMLYSNGSLTLGPSGTLTTQALILNGGALNFGLSTTAANGLIVITGTAAPSVAATTSLAFTKFAGFDNGLYHLMSGYSGQLSTTSFNFFSLNPLSGYVLSLQNDLGELNLLVSQTSNNVVWAGAVNSTWDQATSNWTGSSARFTNDVSTVAFNNTSATTNITVAAGAVRPVDMTVNNDASHPYMFSGGAIVGSGTFYKQGAGALTLANDVSFTAPLVGIQVSGGGTLTVGDGGTHGALAGSVSTDGNLVFNRSDTTSFSGYIWNAERVEQAGSGTLIMLGTGGLYDGDTVISSGTLQIGNGATAGQLSPFSRVVNNGVLAFNRSDNVNFGLDISGTGGLAHNGPGTLELTGTNTYTGVTTVAGGTLQIGFGGNGSLVSDIANNGIVRFQRFFADYTYVGDISGTGSLSQDSTKLILTGNHTYAGVTTNNGILQIGDGGTTGALASTGGIVNSSSLIFNRSDLSTYGGIVSGNGGLTQAGTGTLVITGTNTYGGGTTVAAGTLQTAGNGILPNGGTVNVLAGAALTLSASGAQTLGQVNLFGGAMNVNGNTSITGNFTLSGGLGTANVVNIAAAQTLTITGNVIYSAIGNGLTDPNGAVIGGGGILTLSGVASFTVNDSANAIDDLTVSASLAAASGIRKLGGGTLYLTGDNQTTAATTLAAGTLKIGNNLALGNSTLQITGGTLSGDGTPRTLTNSVNLLANATIGGSSALTLATGVTTGTVVQSGGNRILTVNNSGLTTIQSLQLSEGSASRFLTLSGSGNLQINSIGQGTSASSSLLVNGAGLSLTLNGNNVFGGTATINNGSVYVGHANALGNSALPVSLNVTNSGANISLLTDASFTLARNINVISTTVGAVTLGGATAVTSTFSGNVTFSQSINLIAVSDGTVYFTGTLDDAGPNPHGVNITGGGTIVLTGSNAYSGGTTISGGTLQIGDGGTAGSIVGNVVDNGVLAFNRSDSYTFAGIISGSGSVRVNDAGTLILTADNTYTGVTTISGGTLQIGNGGTSGSLLGSIANNGTLAFNRSNDYTYGGDISGSGSLMQNGLGTLVLTGNNTFTGATTINSGVLLIQGNYASQIYNNTGTQAIVATNTSGTSSIAAPITGNIAFVQQGSGTSVFTGDNTYTGGTTITQGTLQIGDGGTSGSITGSVVNYGTLAFQRSDTFIFSGDVSGTGSVRQVGNGTTILLGQNNYSGGTYVDAGTLELGTSTPAGPIQIAADATLRSTGGSLYINDLFQNNGNAQGTVELQSGATGKGSGQFDNLVVNAGATFSPGNSPGTTTDAATTWNGGTYHWEINRLAGDGGAQGQDPGWDLWNTGVLSINGSFVITVESLTTGNVAGALANWNPSFSQDWRIATASNGAFSSLANLSLDTAAFTAYNNLGGGSFSLLSGGGGNELLLHFSAVPEPSSMILGSLVAAGFAWRRRRKKRTATAATTV